jgi:hypothetical protein
MATVENSTGVRNSDSDVEPQYEPTIDYIPTNTPVVDHPRGARVENRYVDGVLTNEPLWPYPNEDIIKSKMCNPVFLQEIEDKINVYDETSITYLPGLCAQNGTLTEYIWEALGNDCPSGVCEEGPPQIRADVNQDGNINIIDAQLTLRQRLGLDMTSTSWQSTSTTGDVNCDGSLNLTDIRLLLQYSLGLNMTGTGWCE